MYGRRSSQTVIALMHSQRTQYQNAKNTFVELFNLGVIPIVNENDTLAVSVCQCQSSSSKL